MASVMREKKDVHLPNHFSRMTHHRVQNMFPVENKMYSFDP